MSFDQRLVQLYAEMSEHTSELCAGHGRGACRAPHSCCSPEYCEMAMEMAAELRVPLEPTGHASLPMMGPTGCIAPPHVRPLCTLHVCCVNSVGCNPHDAAWTSKYFEVRRAIEILEKERADRL